MKVLLTLGILISSLFCYLEWADQHAFLFQVEWALFFGENSSVKSLAHPLILIPMIGQLLLLVSVFRRQQNYKLVFIGVGCISAIVLMVLLVGILGRNARITLSAIPFVVIAVLTIAMYRRRKLMTIGKIR